MKISQSNSKRVDKWEEIMRKIHLDFIFTVSLLLVVIFSHSTNAQDKPLVKIIAMGGTIANTPDGRLPIDDFVEQIPRITDHAELEVREYIRIGSATITIQNWIDIANIITEELSNNKNIDGIVVTQGSNTAEETAYFLNLVLDTDKPVVIAAAQRDRGKYSSDGSRNLFDAIRVAAHPDASNKGVLVVVNEMIHSARDVTKTISHRVETWDSGDLGILGFSDLDAIRFYRDPLPRHTVTSEMRLNGITNADQMPKVEIVYTYLDANPKLVDIARQSGANGIVVAAFPTGSPGHLTESLKEAEKNGVAVVLSHRGGKGRIRLGREFPSADNLTPQKARILLMLALLNGKSSDELDEIFLTY
jgi:L-asparaginase